MFWIINSWISDDLMFSRNAYAKVLENTSIHWSRYHGLWGNTTEAQAHRLPHFNFVIDSRNPTFRSEMPTYLAIIVAITYWRITICSWNQHNDGITQRVISTSISSSVTVSHWLIWWPVLKKLVPTSPSRSNFSTYAKQTVSWFVSSQSTQSAVADNDVTSQKC